jgi:hypothetical protein
MRTWRVGTISMGATLLLLGIILLCSQLFNLNLTQVMVAWWPIILVVLGIEILVYLFLSRNEKPFLKYDMLSIFLVGILGTVGIGFAILSSTGLVEKAAEVLDRKDQSFDLPEFTKDLTDSVKRVVVQSGNSPLTIEGVSGSEVAMFGTYRAAISGKDELVKTPNDYLSVQQKGDTLYISLKELPSGIGPFDTSYDINPTILVPFNVKLEVTGENSITLKPRMLLSDWTVQDASHVKLYVQDTSDVLVTATGVGDFQGKEDKWTLEEVRKQPVEGEGEGELDEVDSPRSGAYKTGNGTHKLQVTNVFTVDLNPIN